MTTITLKWTHAVKCSGGKDAFISAEVTDTTREGESDAQHSERLLERVATILLDNTWAFNDDDELRRAAKGEGK